jgi:hypothetical protein
MAAKSIQKIDKNRACERYRYEASVLYSKHSGSNDSEAMMYNYSLDGIYLESEHPARPGSDICIKMVNRSPDTCDGYRAQVKWCKKIDRPDISCYGIGVQYSRPISGSVFGFNTYYNLEPASKNLSGTS